MVGAHDITEIAQTSDWDEWRRSHAGPMCWQLDQIIPFAVSSNIVGGLIVVPSGLIILEIALSEADRMRPSDNIVKSGARHPRGALRWRPLRMSIRT